MHKAGTQQEDRGDGWSTLHGELFIMNLKLKSLRHYSFKSHFQTLTETSYVFHRYKLIYHSGAVMGK